MSNPQPLPARYGFSLYRGDTRVWQHQILNDPPPAGDGLPIDITDWTFLSQYRTTTEDGTVLAADVIDIIDAPNGILRRTLTHDQAQLLTPPGLVAWDLQATKADGTVKTYLYNDYVPLGGDVSRS